MARCRAAMGEQACICSIGPHSAAHDAPGLRLVADQSKFFSHSRIRVRLTAPLLWCTDPDQVCCPERLGSACQWQWRVCTAGECSCAGEPAAVPAHMVTAACFIVIWCNIHMCS